MGKYTIFYLFENPRRGMQARNFTINVPKVLDLKSSSEQIFFRKLSLGAPALCSLYPALKVNISAEENLCCIFFPVAFKFVNSFILV